MNQYYRNGIWTYSNWPSKRLCSLVHHAQNNWKMEECIL